MVGICDKKGMPLGETQAHRKIYFTTTQENKIGNKLKMMEKRPRLLEMMEKRPHVLESFLREKFHTS